MCSRLGRALQAGYLPTERASVGGSKEGAGCGGGDPASQLRCDEDSALLEKQGSLSSLCTTLVPGNARASRATLLPTGPVFEVGYVRPHCEGRRQGSKGLVFVAVPALLLGTERYAHAQ